MTVINDKVIRTIRVYGLLGYLAVQLQWYSVPALVLTRPYFAC